MQKEANANDEQVYLIRYGVSTEAIQLGRRVEA